MELVKIYDDNILVAIKLDISNGYWYMASIYEINNSKLERRLNSGKLVRYIDNSRNK